VCWCPPWCGAPLRAPRGVVCTPVVGACPVCCPPLRWVLAPCAGAPPRCCGPDRDHCYDCLEATAPHRIHSLAPWRHQGSGHPDTPMGRVSGGLGRCTPSSTARSRRSVSRAVVQQPVAAAATAPLPTYGVASLCLPCLWLCEDLMMQCTPRSSSLLFFFVPTVTPVRGWAVLTGIYGFSLSRVWLYCVRTFAVD